MSSLEEEQQQEMMLTLCLTGFCSAEAGKKSAIKGCGARAISKGVYTLVRLSIKHFTNAFFFKTSDRIYPIESPIEGKKFHRNEN